MTMKKGVSGSGSWMMLQAGAYLSDSSFAKQY